MQKELDTQLAAEVQALEAKMEAEVAEIEARSTLLVEAQVEALVEKRVSEEMEKQRVSDTTAATTAPNNEEFKEANSVTDSPLGVHRAPIGRS